MKLHVHLIDAATMHAGEGESCGAEVRAFTKESAPAFGGIEVREGVSHE